MKKGIKRICDFRFATRLLALIIIVGLIVGCTACSSNKTFNSDKTDNKQIESEVSSASSKAVSSESVSGNHEVNAGESDNANSSNTKDIIPNNSDTTTYNNTDRSNDLQEIVQMVYKAYLFNLFLVDAHNEEDYLTNFKNNCATLYEYTFVANTSSSSSDVYCNQSYNDMINDYNQSKNQFLPYFNRFHFISSEIKSTQILSEDEYEKFHINDMTYNYDEFSEILKVEISTEVDLGDDIPEGLILSNYFPEQTPQYNIAGKLGGNWYLWYLSPWTYTQKNEEHKRAEEIAR